ncbi:MAG: YkvA family protein [bacterium]|nr:YkvA family protein [bacterium]
MQKKNLKERARELKTEAYALYLAYRDPRVPWYAKAFAACVVAYALSPIDLIPDFIPVLGYLDDLVLIPLGIALAVKMIPGPVMLEARGKARILLDRKRPVNWMAGLIIIIVWLSLAGALILVIKYLIKKLVF